MINDGKSAVIAARCGLEIEKVHLKNELFSGDFRAEWKCKFLLGQFINVHGAGKPAKIFSKATCERGGLWCRTIIRMPIDDFPGKFKRFDLIF